MRVWHPPIGNWPRRSGCFPAFFDLIHQPLCVINERGEYVYYNQESARIYRTATALSGQWRKHMLDVYPGMKETQKYDAFIVKKGVEYIGHYQIYLQCARPGPLTIGHHRAALYEAMAAMVGVIGNRQEYVWRQAARERLVGRAGAHMRHHEKHHAPLLPKTRKCSVISPKAKRLAASNIPVTIVGETGAGGSYFPA